MSNMTDESKGRKLRLGLGGGHDHQIANAIRALNLTEHDRLELIGNEARIVLKLCRERVFPRDEMRRVLGCVHAMRLQDLYPSIDDLVWWSERCPNLEVLTIEFLDEDDGELSAENKKRLARLFPKLRRLTMVGCHVAHVCDFLRAMPRLQSLTYLDRMDDCAKHMMLVSCIRAHPSLRHIYINALTDLEWSSDVKVQIIECETYYCMALYLCRPIEALEYYLHSCPNVRLVNLRHRHNWMPVSWRRDAGHVFLGSTDELPSPYYAHLRLLQDAARRADVVGHGFAVIAFALAFLRANRRHPFRDMAVTLGLPGIIASFIHDKPFYDLAAEVCNPESKMADHTAAVEMQIVRAKADLQRVTETRWARAVIGVSVLGKHRL
jgi:hypothetical protein